MVSGDRELSEKLVHNIGEDTVVKLIAIDLTGKYIGQPSGRIDPETDPLFYAYGNVLLYLPRLIQCSIWTVI